MARWTNAKGDTITTSGSIYTITRNGHASSCDVSRWKDSAETWIRNDIKSGYYSDFSEVMESSDLRQETK
jgi:hypothetical protein